MAHMDILLEDQCMIDVPMPNREIFRKSIVYQDAVAWNGLDNEIKCWNTMSFKHLYKSPHTCNVHIGHLIILFTNVILVYWAPRWSTC